ncbi:hypothetical protein HO173_000545 [Letharia columbiana]|uniref:Uncharacterized protein n=1 Tax=Letharia columbiana TaxID=112416 RepID=A0A8H6G725_9LECA|nr:uncharacterized protein HO173_000545 [Letharia columbiana]KAF6241833.1 hypothetical protein HO173_000545 [Letharia columbiana]
MYQLHPCAEWRRFKDSPLPEPKYNPDGTVVYEQWTRPGQGRRPLLDFKLLPDKASFIVANAIFHDVLTSLDLHRGSLVVS